MAVSEWDNSCRLCSEQQSEMFSIFGEEGLRRKVANKLRVCLPVMVYKTDPLPKKICQFCAARLDDAYEFREYCLSVYKSMHRRLLTLKNLKTVEMYLEAMKNSPDPCQVQLCKEKARALPPLVPLPGSLMMKRAATNAQLSANTCSEPLTELPCEVEIKEDPNDAMLVSDSPFRGTVSNHRKSSSSNFSEIKIDGSDECDVIIIDDSLAEDPTLDNIMKTEGDKRTSILEQVLTGNLTIKDNKELSPKTKLTSQWWCSPCNSYYRTKSSLMKHVQLFCPRKYTCSKCSLIFQTVQELAKHEATDHLKVTFDFEESVKECHECDREFVSSEMLRHHRLHDHTAGSIDIDTNTWCPICNRIFPTVELYYSHKKLHDAEDSSSKATIKGESNVQIEKNTKETKDDYSVENVRSLTCPTCGKVCTQQSALSNHMRTHEPKKHKCEICGRSFGLFIRLAAHRLSEHGQQPIMSPITASVEQEEALNAEREAREARVSRKPKNLNRKYSEISDRDGIGTNESTNSKRKTRESVNNGTKNVARCGICQQWFTDHTTMLTHLQTHSDNLASKTFTCRVCKKTFKEKWQLSRHEVSHKRSKISHTCNVCNKTFAGKKQLKSHKAIHTLNKTYHCQKCNKIFFKEFSLMTHRCTETPVFGKKNTTPIKTARKVSSAPNRGSKRVKNSQERGNLSNLKTTRRNSRIASVENKKETCETPISNDENNDIMPKLSPENSPGTSTLLIEPKVEINEEKNIPTPVKRTLVRTAGGYRCGVCQSPFILRELAVAHLRSAHPTMPYQCPYCKKRFTTQYTFTHHIKAEHPNESEK